MEESRFAREHRVRYEIEREVSPTRPAGTRAPMFDVRVFASHERDPLPAPACQGCLELLGELRSFVERTVAGAGLSAGVEISPEAGRLYESKEEGVHDEVTVDVRLVSAASPTPEETLRALTDRLDAAGVTRR
jgi:hypothetical protein